MLAITEVQIYASLHQLQAKETDLFRLFLLGIHGEGSNPQPSSGCNQRGFRIRVYDTHLNTRILQGQGRLWRREAVWDP